MAPDSGYLGGRVPEDDDAAPDSAYDTNGDWVEKWARKWWYWIAVPAVGTGIALVAVAVYRLVPAV